jgi:flagellar assembly protein FliH
MTWWAEPAPKTARRVLPAGSLNGSARPARLLVDPRRHRARIDSDPADDRPDPLEVLAEAFAEARKDAYEAGRASALSELEQRYREHTEQMATRVSEAIEALRASCEEVAKARQAAIEVVEQDAVELAFELTRALVGRELELAEAPVRDALRRALSLAPEGEPLTIRICPGDLGTVRDLVNLAGADVSSSCSIVADAGVEPGGCVVDAGPCRIDAQLGPALERVRVVLGALGNRVAGGTQAGIQPEVVVVEATARQSPSPARRRRAPGATEKAAPRAPRRKGAVEKQPAGEATRTADEGSST